MASLYGTLLKKNYLYWKRDTFCCTCQIITAIVFALFLTLIRGIAGSLVVTKSDTSYLNNPKFDLKFDLSAVSSKDQLIDAFAAKAKLGLAGKGKPFMKNCNYIRKESGTGEPRDGGYVALASVPAAMKPSFERFFVQVGFKYKYFESLASLEEDIMRDDYGKSVKDGVVDAICFGVSFESTDLGKWAYNLHFNVSGNPAKTDLLDTNFKQQVDFKEEELPDGNTRGAYDRYLTSGALLMQNLIDNLILQTDSGVPTAKIQSRHIPVPTRGYKDNGLFDATNGGAVDIYVIFPLLVVYLGLIYHMLKEKERKITENMRNMGMQLLPHYLAWYTFYFAVLVMVSLIWSAITCLTFFTNSSFVIVFLLIFMPGLVLLGLAFVICSFFVTAKPGVLFGIVSFFVLYACSIGKQTVDVPTEKILNLFALSPFTGVAMAGANITLLETVNDFGFQFSNFNQLIQFFRFSSFFAICLVEAALFFLLGIYLDQVWPTEIGIKKHPLFCFGLKSRSEDRDVASLERVDEAYQKKYYEELTEELKGQQQEPGQTLSITGLRKVYSNGKVAVHDLSLQMFNNQIFVLLGHNGAGKTTTISMISGLLTQTRGNISICGFDTLAQSEEVKQVLGVCPQLNPIYDNLTCKEHLVLYGKIKTQGKATISEQEIDQVLKDIDLFDKKNYVAGRLSGGQKRKLCIGIAFIGGSKVILLDEPTSGMDTYARRYLWDMIKKYKKDRIIILCTHYMDEADYLGDRFGIMGEGKLITCGSSLFLKKTFGVGYDLTVVKRSSKESSDSITELIKRHVPTCEKTGDISMEVKYKLPTEQSGQFEGLFTALEDSKQEYGVQSFGISLTTLEEVFLKVAQGAEKDPNASQKQPEMKEQSSSSDFDFQLDDVRIKGKFDVFRMHFTALCVKRFIYFKRDFKGLFCEVVLPIIIITIGLAFTLIEFLKDPKVVAFTPENFLERKALVWANEPSGLGFDSFYSKLPQSPLVSLATKIDTSDITAFQTHLMKTPVRDRFFSYFVQSRDATAKTYDYAVFFNTTTTAVNILSTSLMHTAIYRDALGNPSASISVTNRALKLTKAFKNFEKSADGFIAVFNFALAYAFIPAGVILFIVKERENNVKHQQIVSGVSIYAYWLSNLLIDCCKYAIPGVYCALSILIFGVDAFTDNDNYSAVWAVILLYGPAIMTFTYLTSFMFKSPESAQIATFVFNFMVGFVLLFLCFALRFIKSTRDLTPYFPELFFRLFPTYDFSWGLFNVANVQLWQALYRLDRLPKAWSRWGGLLDIVYLALLPLAFLGAIFYIELRSGAVDQKSARGQELVDLAAGDEAVRAERAAVRQSEDFAIKVVDFVKEYKMVSKKRGGFCSKKFLSSKVAVKGVSFGVQKGDCFGLLGTNGAGKTTTFKALTGEILPTFGVTKIAGFDLARDMDRVRHLIGYCPQFDALLDNLTAREHLELFAAIKGIPVGLREKLIRQTLDQLHLSRFEHVQAGTYSGGNKRKLSVALAILGNPPVILLDEPSSGMDPEARRFMWSVIGKISSEKKHSSVVLTTHSMEEAEALSTKLAIMVEGSIECIGSVQGLKSKYGKGFEVEVKLRAADAEEVELVRRTLGISATSMVSTHEIEDFLKRLSLGDLCEQISREGKLSALYHQVTSCDQIELMNGCTQALFFDQVILQTRVRTLESFLQQQFGQVTLIESVNSFYRYKLPDSLRISKLFGELERNQERLKLAQYSVKQTTIEQIFINFANQRSAQPEEE